MNYSNNPRKGLVRSASSAVLATVLLLAACGGGSTSDDPSTPDAGGTETGGEIDAIDTSVEGATAIFDQVKDLPLDEAMALIEECAIEEGTITHYTHEDDMVPGWEEVWPTLYPDIEYQGVIGDTTANIEKVLAEFRSGNHTVDVVAGNAESHGLYDTEGVLATHDSFYTVENFPDRAKFANFTSQNINPAVIAWNTNLVPEDMAPDSYDDFLDPDFPEPIGIDGSPPNPMAALVAAWGEEEVRSWLTELFETKEVRVIEGHGAGRNLLAAGEIAAHIELFVGDLEAIIVEDGAPIDWYAADPSGASSAGTMIAENAPHPCAAALFANFLSSVEGSQVVADMGTTVQNPDVDFPYPRLIELLDNPNLKVIYPGSPEAESMTTARQIINEIIVPNLTGG